MASPSNLVLLQLSAAGKAQKSVGVLLEPSDWAGLLKVAQNKLRFRAKRVFLAKTGEEVFPENCEQLLRNEIRLVLTKGDTYSASGKDAPGSAPQPVKSAANDPPQQQDAALAPGQPAAAALAEAAPLITLLCSDDLVEKAAVDQLHQAATNLAGIRLAAGMPDLHPGNSHPIGAALASEGWIHPHLVDGDIGCGMALVRFDERLSRILLTNTSTRKRLTKLAESLDGLEGAWGSGSPQRWLTQPLSWGGREIEPVRLSAEDGAWRPKASSSSSSSSAMHAADQADEDLILQQLSISDETPEQVVEERAAAADTQDDRLLREALEEAGLSLRQFDGHLGTIGAGNHFAELQEVAEVVDPELFKQIGMVEGRLFLMIHSGSRGFGKAVLNAHQSRHGNRGLRSESPEARRYLALHDTACAWARRNRALIGQRFLNALGSSLAEAECLLDIHHNTMTELEFPQPLQLLSPDPEQPPQQGADHADGGPQEPLKLWVHRKGAAPSDQGPVVIPGSRGAHSYVCMPTGPSHQAVYSLAHGAGRKFARGKAARMVKNPQNLIYTSLESIVICDNKQLLCEEAPEAYKEIHEVVGQLERRGLLKVIAVMKPVLTYKLRLQDGR